VAFATSSVVTQQGEIEGVIAIGQDLTRMRELERRVIQAEKLASLGQLAASVVHEINNPMTVILSNGEMLRDLLPPDDQAREHVDLILSAGKRSSKIVRNLLDFSGRMQIEFSATDLHKTIDDTVSLLKHQFKRSSTSIECDLQAQPPTVLGNRDQLQVVWMNLLVNALDALGERPEGRHIRVRSTQSEDGRIQVTVADNGNGIPPETAKHLFEPFFTTKRPGVGTGLGLFNCYNIISQHGGDISVDSQLGTGTTFTINLPAYS
jgi:signal transduction histidine kinase